MKKALIIILSITLLLTIFLLVVFRSNLSKGKSIIYGNATVTGIPYVSVDMDYVMDENINSHFKIDTIYKNSLVSYEIDYLIGNYQYIIITEYVDPFLEGDISINANMFIYWYENPNDNVITNDGFEIVVKNLSCMLNVSRYLDLEGILNEDITGIDILIDGYNSALTLEAYLQVLQIEFPKIEFGDNNDVTDYLKDILSVFMYPNSLVRYIFNVDDMINIIYGYKLLEVN